MEIDEKKITEFTKRVSPAPCALCGNNNWVIENRVFYMPEFHKGETVIGGNVYPVVPIICSNCGHVLFVSAVASKLIERD